MVRIFLVFLFLLLTFPASADIFALRNDNVAADILNDLIFSERQLFNRTYRSEDISQRLERLELAVYGAIQDGPEANRIRQIRKALTNVVAGGNGLQYVTKGLGLTGLSSSSKNWSFGGYNYGTPYHTNAYRRHDFNRCAHAHSHRLPPPCPNCHSHRLPPPKPYGQNNPIINGDYTKNYSLGTSVRILND